MEFTTFPKIPRLRRDVVITEKLDGTNAQVVISPASHAGELLNIVASNAEFVMRVGSRSRWITPGKSTDNYGFAGWCLDNAEQLFTMGEGQHFGEWFGSGIQRNYGLAEKRFALFNTARWGAHNPNTPQCCTVVPVLYTGPDATAVERCVQQLRDTGSVAAPGFMNPEGVVVYHTAARTLSKVTLEKDDSPKSVEA